MNILFKFYLVIRTIKNFPTAFLDKGGFIKKEAIYYIRNSKLRFLVRGGTEDISEIVVVASGYEYNLKRIDLPANPTIIDIGGHIGTFSIYVASKFNDKCKVFIFEPDKNNYKILLKNLVLNKLNSITPLNLAISNYRGKGYLKVKNMNTDAYFLDVKENNIKNCHVDTLPHILDKLKVGKVDLLKMDIEGGEYAIFKDRVSLNYIKKRVHYIFLEYHDMDRFNNFSEINKILSGNFRTLNKQRQVLTLENLKWSFSSQQL